MWLFFFAVVNCGLFSKMQKEILSFLKVFQCSGMDADFWNFMRSTLSPFCFTRKGNVYIEMGVDRRVDTRKPVLLQEPQEPHGLQTEVCLGARHDTKCLRPMTRDTSLTTPLTRQAIINRGLCDCGHFG